jgi:hypothetical protein
VTNSNSPRLLEHRQSVVRHTSRIIETSSKIREMALDASSGDHTKAGKFRRAQSAEVNVEVKEAAEKVTPTRPRFLRL